MISLVVGVLFPVFYGDGYNWLAALAVFVASWIFTSLAADMLHRARHASSLRVGLRKLSLSYHGMVVAHAGIAVTLIGVCLNSLYADLRDVGMAPGEAVQSGRYEFTLDSVYKVQGPNYIADEALVEVRKDGRLIREMRPQKRQYLAGGRVMTEVALAPGLLRDIYLAMGEPLEQEGAWAMRVHIKPFVRWIWLGALMMALGAVMAMADKRYRKRKSRSAAKEPTSGSESA